jgi:hypothetical protein
MTARSVPHLSDHFSGVTSISVARSRIHFSAVVGLSAAM